jgi:importin subunit beta-1
MEMLCKELCEEVRPTEVRQAAGVALKNALVAKDPQRRHEYARRWLAAEPSVRERMKLQLLNALGARDYRAGTAAAQATSAIAFVELPVGGWPSLLEILLVNAASTNENMRRCTLETIGFICEEIEPRVLKAQSNVILTVVVNGLRASETSTSVRAAAARAMLSCLEFARDNFDIDSERDMIMNVVCTATQANDESIVLPAFECLVQIMQLYYFKMESYMRHAVARLTIESIKSPNEAIKLQVSSLLQQAH